jgi:hypothetical protein
VFVCVRVCACVGVYVHVHYMSVSAYTWVCMCASVCVCVCVCIFLLCSASHCGQGVEQVVIENAVPTCYADMRVSPLPAKMEAGGAYWHGVL